MKKLLLLFGVISCWTSVWAQKPNIAPSATITCTGLQATFPPSTLNDLNLGTCGTQQFWMSSTSGSTTDYIEWNWPLTQSFDEITFHQADNVPSRQLVGGVLQSWNGSAWVTAATFSNLPLACENTITFQRITTNRLRMTQMVIGAPGATQFTNVNFREIEIFQASVAINDAGITLVDSAQAACPGSYPVNATVQNFGINQIDSVLLNWSVDGVAQTSVWHKNLLDTIGGLFPSSAVVALGNYTFAANTNYTVKVWTSMPNGGIDTTGYNDTLSSVVRLAAPTGFMASNVMTTSADLSWNTLGASNFRITYGPAGFNPQSGGTTITATGSSTTVSPLLANTLYEAYLVADCGGSVYSDTTGPISFRTPCTVAIAPFSENFDSTSSWFASGSNAGNTIDPCWTSFPDVSQGSEPFKWIPRGTGPTSGNGPLQDLTGGNFMYVEASGSGAGDTALLTTPPIDVSGLTTPGLYFFQHRFSGATIADMEILVSNDFGTTWSNVYNITGDVQSASGDPWELEFVNLVAYTGDTIMVRFKQDGNGCCGDAAIDSVVVDEAPTCPWPTSLAMTNRTDSSVTIGWNDPTGTNWELQWGPPGFTQASPGAGTKTTSYNPDTITGLQSNTEYEVYVRTDCGPNGQSIWIGPITVRTSCSPFMAPYTDNFDNSPNNAVPYCWANYITGGRTTPGVAQTYQFATPVSSPNHIRFYNGSPAGPGDTTLLISPKFSDLTVGDKRVQFMAQSSTTLVNELVVGTMGDPMDALSFNALDTVALTTTYQLYVVNLDAAAGYNGTDEYVAFRHGNSATFRTIYIDNFLYEMIPLCNPPLITTLGVAGVSPTSATIYWGAGSDGFETHWEVGPVGFTPGTNSYTSADSVAGNIDTTVAAGLTAQTNYEFYIRDSCASNGYSPWVGPFSFTTACNIFTAPLSEDFDGTSWVASGSNAGNSLDPCWTSSPDVDNSSVFKWIPRSTGPTSGNGPLNDKTGVNYLYCEASGAAVGNIAYLYSPIVDVSTLTVPAIYFSQHRYSGATIADMDVEVTNDFGATWTNVYSVTGDIQTSNSGAWDDQIIALGAFVGDTIQVRFVQTSNGCCGDAAIDDVEIKEAPTCPDVISLAAGSILDTTATLSWVGNPNTGSYQIWFGPQGFYQGTATVGGAKSIQSAASIIVDSLTGNTCYEFLIRGICSPGDTGNWVGPVSFCTPCSPISAPYLENFDALSTAQAGNLGNCWVGSGTTSTYSWRTNSGGTPSSPTGPTGDATSGNGIYLFTEASSGGVGDIATMTSPLVDISALSNPEVRFSYHMFGTNIDTLKVDVFDGTQWNLNVLHLDEQQQTASADPWKDTLIDLTPYSSNNLVQVRFTMKSRGCCTGDAAIDDVEFSEPITCPSPSNLSVTSVVGNSATLGWSGVGSPQSYIVEYGPGGFTPGTGTSASVTGTSYVINNLPQNNIAYQAYVRAYCGGTDSSFWAGPVTILTAPNLCTEDFEVYNTGLIDGQSTLFVGWNGDGGDAEVSTAQSSSGSKSLHIYNTGPNTFSDIVTNLDTSFTSGIHSLKFNMFIPTSFGGYYNILHNYTGPTNVWAIEVYIDATTGTATVNGGTNSTAVVGTYSTTPNSWNTIEHIIDLDNDTAWVMVNGVNTNLGWQFSFGSTNFGDRFNAVNFYSAANPGQVPNYYVDDFCVQPYVPVSCPAPTTLNVSSTNIGCDSAEVSWVSQSASNNSILEYGPTGYTPGTGTAVPFVTSPYTITGLSAGTTYDFYVADTCASDTSSVAGPLTFTTDPAPVAHASFTWSSAYTATTQDVTFDASGSSNADTYDWDFGNTSTGTGVNPTESYGLPNGSFSVKLTVTNACGGSDDTTLVINTNIGLNDLAVGQSFKVYPNPNNGEFTVEVDLAIMKDNRITINDLSGREVFAKEITSTSGKYSGTFKLDNLPKGVYMINLKTKHGTLVRRLVIE